MEDTAPAAPASAGTDALAYGADMGERIRAFDWSATPLGSRGSWAPALRTLVDVMLGSGQPMFVTWGPERTLLYNDGYAGLLGRRHPSALGRGFPAVWSEVWDELLPLFESVDAGRPIHMTDLQLVLERNGYPEEAHFAFSYTPVRDAGGQVAGMFCACTETTAQVLSQRRLRESEERQRLLIEGASDYAMFTIDLEGRITSWSGGAVKIFGLTPEQAIGEAADILYTPQDRAAGRPQLELASARQEGCANDERWHQRADGSRVYMNGAVRPLHGEGGQLIGFLKVARDETERRRYTDALERNERQFREMADSAPVMLWVTDADGVCTYLNRPWYAFTGQSQAEAEGFGWLEATHPEDKERAGAIFAESNARREPFYVEYRLRRADGSYAWAIDMATPRFAPDGAYLGYVGSVIDITPRHEAEEALRRSEAQARATELALRDSEARFRAITDSVDQMIWSTLPDGHHDYFNRRWYEYTGVPDGSTDGDGWNGVFHPDDQQRSMEVWAGSLETGRAYHIEYRLRRRDGQYRWVLGRAQPVRDEDGRIIRWFGTCTDIQEIVEAREVLARSRQVLEEEVEARTEERDSIWRISQDLFLICGFDGLYRSVNPAWREALGYAEEELVGMRFDALAHPEDVAATRQEFARLIAGEILRNFDIRVRAKDGAYRWFSWTCVPAEGDVFYAAGRDVTESKELESQLRQAQKMEAVGQLTGGIAHDFNNLLQIVVGNLELAQRNLPEDATRLKRSVTNAMTGAKRAATLTERLLAFSRRQPLAPKPVSANRLVAGMSELLGRSLGETIQVETVLAGGLWRVEADPNQLENAIVNLAVNARDAMPDGGRLTIETANTRLDESYAQQNLEVAPGQYVVICVSDTGTGMDKEALARAFEPFFTTKGIGKGTGLGLSQVYGFVKQSGGHVKIYSESDETEGRHRGTTVKIYLPRYLGPGEQGEEEPEEGQALQGGLDETILVVEDDPDVRAYTVEVLRELGYRVVEAADGPTALKLLRDAETPCDLLFTDVVLPGGINGEQLARAAHEARPGLRVLFTTGYARNAIVHHGRLDPGVELITKPFTYADLAARVRDLLDGAPPEPPRPPA